MGRGNYHSVTILLYGKKIESPANSGSPNQEEVSSLDFQRRIVLDNPKGVTDNNVAPYSLLEENTKIVVKEKFTFHKIFENTEIIPLVQSIAKKVKQLLSELKESILASQEPERIKLSRNWLVDLNKLSGEIDKVEQVLMYRLLDFRAHSSSNTTASS